MQRIKRIWMSRCINVCSFEYIWARRIENKSLLSAFRRTSRINGRCAGICIIHRFRIYDSNQIFVRQCEQTIDHDLRGRWVELDNIKHNKVNENHWMWNEDTYVWRSSIDMIKIEPIETLFEANMKWHLQQKWPLPIKNTIARYGTAKWVKVGRTCFGCRRERKKKHLIETKNQYWARRNRRWYKMVPTKLSSVACSSLDLIHFCLFSISSNSLH